MSETVHAVGVGALLRPGPARDPQAAHRAQQTALSDAYAQGVQHGEAAAMSSVSEVQAEVRMLHAAALAAAAAAHNALASVVTDTLAELAITIARAIIVAEPHVRLETVQNLVSEALAAAPADASGTIFVPIAALDAAASSIPPGWTLAADPLLPPGTARATLGASAFTASLERRLTDVSAWLAETA